MKVEKIIENKENLVKFLKEKGFVEENDYFDEDYKEGTYFKVDKRKLLVVYEVIDEEKIKEIKDYFLIDRGLSYCIIIFNHKLIFYRNFGETKYFIYSERTKSNVSKKDKLDNIKDFDLIFQSKDISAQFYEGFKLKRNFLVQHIKNDIQPTQKYLIAQKIFDRFFFIYFLCHKGIIKFEDGRKISGENLFSRIFLKEKGFLENLKKLFHLFNSQEKNVLKIKDYKIIIPYLNGGLFRPDVLEQDLNISLKNKDWEIIFDFLNSYHWIIEDVKVSEENEDKILTPEILGHVYERSVVEWEKIGIEEEAEKVVKKVTERKKIGVYYTPEPITNYISNNTIIPYLLDKLDNKYKVFEDLIESKNKQDYKKALEILDEIKVLDPACGSGAFLIKASEVIYFLKRRLLHELKEKHNFYDLKLDLITENIYGVDILSGAIEISKLRLWLWLISDFEESKNEIKALPNIEYNLKVGNSLIGWLDEKLTQLPTNTPLTEKVDGIFIGLIAFSENGDEEELKKARELLRRYNIDEYIEAYYILYKIYRRTHGLKAENLRSILETVRKSIYSTVTPAFLESVNKKIKPKYNTSKPPITKKEFDKLQVFHWRIDFGHIILNGGFDVVIGNPPYVQKNAFSKYIKEGIKRLYPENCSNMNIAAVFINRANMLNHQNGIQGMIVPKSLTFSKFWLNDRINLLERLINIVDVSKAFKGVLLEQIIYLAIKSNTVTKIDGKKYTITKYFEGEFAGKFDIEKKVSEEIGILLTSINDFEFEIFEFIKNNSFPLGDITNTFCGLPYQSQLTNVGEFRTIGGKEIGRFKLKGTKGYFSKKFLDSLGKVIINFSKKKIISQDIVAHITKPIDHIKLMSYVDNEKLITVNTVNNTYLIDEKYRLESICAILNSKLISWLHYRFTFNRAVRTMHFYEFFISKTRVSNNLLKYQDLLVYLYNLIVQIVDDEDSFNLVDNIINCLVYEIYFDKKLNTKLFDILTKLIPPDNLMPKQILHKFQENNEINLEIGSILKYDWIKNIEGFQNEKM